MNMITDEMQQARRDLQGLSASDPAAQRNMLRYCVALALLVAGRRGNERTAGEPCFLSGFQFGEGERELIMAVTARSGQEQIYLAFDIDDPAGPPVSLGVVRKEGEETVCYGKCQLWAPAAEGRAVVVPIGVDDHGHFAFQRGRPLKHIQSRPNWDLQAGLRRGAARLTKLAQSADLPIDPADLHIVKVDRRGVVKIDLLAAA